MSLILYSKLIHGRISRIIEETHKTCKTESLSPKAYPRIFDTNLDGKLAEYYNVPAIKSEMFYNQDWTGIKISEFIDILNEYLLWYNTKRIKTSLRNMSP